MKYLITLTLLCFALIGQSSAQLSTNNHDPQIGSGLQKGQHQLGLSFDLNRNFELTHRFALKDDLLLRTSLKTPRIAYTSNGRNTYVGLGAALGIEKHMSIGRKWSAYYGAELGTFWGNRSNSLKTQTINVSGFAGLKYNVNDRVSLFTEVKYGYNYSRFSLNNGENASLLNSSTAINLGVLITLGKMK